jgi:hypothetical protein
VARIDRANRAARMRALEQIKEARMSQTTLQPAQ